MACPTSFIVTVTSSCRLAVYLNPGYVPDHGRAIQHVHGKLLSQRVWLVAQNHAHAEVAELGVLGNSSRSRQRLREAAYDQADRVPGEREVMSGYRGAARLRDELGPEYEEVFQLPNGSIHHCAQARFARRLKLADPVDLAQGRISGCRPHHLLLFSPPHFRSPHLLL